MDKHLAVYISNKDNKQVLIERIISGQFISTLSNLKGALFSEITLNKFIAEEIHHGRFDVNTKTKNSLQKSSEGERKKALLNHIISENPEYIIVDNVFGNLDITAQSDIEKTLEHLSKEISIVQISNRKADMLSFINDIFQVQEGKLVPLKNIDESKITESKRFIGALPKPYKIANPPVNPLVCFNNVTIAYNERTIVNNICWEIKTGEFWQLIGPNGSGKSTLLSLISGDNPKAYGQDITLFGIKKGSGESVWDIKENVGYFSSEILRGFKRSDSIGNMVVSGFYDTIGLYKMPTHAQIKIARQWLYVLDMFDIRKSNFLSLSIGHQLLVLIARAMVKQPPLLILDEPTNGLDDVDAKLFSGLINKIASESNTAILYVSHRKEKNLKPEFVYQLTSGSNGSIGKKVL